MRQFLLVKPNYRFNGLARTEWQIYTFMTASDHPADLERGRDGCNSRMIFSGSKADCLSVLEGKGYCRREYRSGTKICQGHYTPSGMFTIARVKGAVL